MQSRLQTRFRGVGVFGCQDLSRSGNHLVDFATDITVHRHKGRCVVFRYALGRNGNDLKALVRALVKESRHGRPRHNPARSGQGLQLLQIPVAVVRRRPSACRSVVTIEARRDVRRHRRSLAVPWNAIQNEAKSDDKAIA